MTAFNNIIEKQIVHFNYVGNIDGISLQKEVSVWMHEILNPQIEDWLKRYQDADQLFFIPELILEVDVQANSQWQQVLSDKIIQQLKQKLPVGLYANDIEIISKSSQLSFADQLLYYIKNGYLAWNAQIKNRNDFTTQISNWLAHTKVQDLEKLFKKIDSENIVDRFLAAVSDGDKIKLFAKLLQLNKDQFLSLQSDFNLLLDESSNSKVWYPAFLYHICNCSSLDKNIDLNILMQTWIVELQKRYDVNLKTIPLEKFQTETIQNSIKEIQHKNNKTIPIVEKLSTQHLIQDEFIRDNIYINNAGVIIIAPFLHALFEKSGIVKGNKIIDSDIALALIHYCITGNTNPAEFELVLPKILCGIPIQQTVVLNAIITQKYQDEANEMLMAVIEHWSVLKGSTINGLRESFLQRSGKLSINNKQWLLQVEQQSFDMLLRHLPWNISMIKLPWMNEMLITEWI